MYVTSWLNRNDRLLISTRCTFFSGRPDPKNSKVKRAWLGAILGWVTDREIVPGCARVRTKCVGKTSVGLWGQSRSRQAYAENRWVWPGRYKYMIRLMT